MAHLTILIVVACRILQASHLRHVQVAWVNPAVRGGRGPAKVTLIVGEA